MSSVVEIESAIRQLPESEFWKLATWFDNLRSNVWVNASEIYLNKNDNTTVRKYSKSTLQRVAAFPSDLLYGVRGGV